MRETALACGRIERRCRLAPLNASATRGIGFYGLRRTEESTFGLRIGFGMEVLK
jgi:hypothetical protein